MEQILKVQNLEVVFESYEGDRTVLDIEEFSLQRGESVGLVGESESGKSVLAFSILDILPMPPGRIERGEIIWEGENLLGKDFRRMKNIQGQEIAMIFQDPKSTLNPVITVGKQITNVLQKNHGWNRKKAYEKALQYLEQVKLSDPHSIMAKYPHELSGGQRQRIIIAIALSCGAKLLIADEPTRNLDVTIQAGVLKLLAELKKELQITTLFLTNNMGLVPVMCDRAGILHKGRIVEQGPAKTVVQNPRHPYTRMLLELMPGRKEISEETLQQINVAEKDTVISGDACLYYPYCSRALEECRKQRPKLDGEKEEHLVACFNPIEGEKA